MLRAECKIEKNVFLAVQVKRTLMWIFRVEEINRPIEHLLRPQNSTFTSRVHRAKTRTIAVRYVLKNSLLSAYEQIKLVVTTVQKKGAMKASIK